MKTHLTRFRVTYITATVSVCSAIGVEFGALKDMPAEQLHAKPWPFWVAMGAAVVVQAGNTILAALHQPPSDSPPITPKQ